MRRPGQKNKRAYCLFCKGPIEKPQAIPATPRREFPGGKCDCGTVYVSDPTGKYGGEALMEVLTFACNDDIDKAYSLKDGEDYKLKIISYNTDHHTFNKSGHFKDGNARLYFLKLQSKE